MTIRKSKRVGGRSGLAVLMLVGAGILVPQQSASALPIDPDFIIFGQERILDPEEILDHDITGTTEADDLLADLDTESADAIDGQSVQVFEFNGQTTIIPTAVALEVAVGENESGVEVHEIRPLADGVGGPEFAGFVVPPQTAWKYNNENSLVETAGTWTRTIWWNLTKANDYKASSSSPAYDYWRITGKMRFAAKTGSSAYEGYKRGWIEFNPKAGWATQTSFESDQPESSIPGVANQTTTIGFGSSMDISLGVAPKVLGGSVSASYSGSITKSSENWHPVIRDGIGNGGVQYCSYASGEITGTRVITTRVGARISSSGNMAGWTIATGMAQSTSRCPNQD